MNETYRQFLNAVARDLGSTPSEIALDCIAATMNLPSLAKYAGGNPPACRFDLTVPTAADTVSADAPDTSALEAEIASLKAEIASLRAAATATVTGVAPTKAPKAPKAPKVAPASGNLADTGNLKAVVVDGTETAVRSWRAGAMHMLGLLTAAGQKGTVPSGWFRDEASDRTVTLPSGDHAFASIVTGDCEKRIRKVAEVLGVGVTLRIVAEDGSTTDAAL